MCVCTEVSLIYSEDVSKYGCVSAQEIPLMYQLLVSGNQQHVQEQSWVLHLLAAGLRGPQDAQLYRSAVNIFLYFWLCCSSRSIFLLLCPCPACTRLQALLACLANQQHMLCLSLRPRSWPLPLLVPTLHPSLHLALSPHPPPTLTPPSPTFIL